MSSNGTISGLLRNLKIGTRLTILFCVALFVTIVIALTGMVNNKRLATCINLTYQAITRPLAAVADARGEFNAMRAALYDLAQDFNTDTQNVQFRRQVERNLDAYEQNVLLYQDILSKYGTRDPYEIEAVEYLYSQLQPLRRYVESIIRIGSQPGRSADAVLVLRGDFLKTADDISSDLAALTRILEAQTNEANLYADRLRHYNDLLSTLISGLGALFFLIIAGVIVKSITGPMNDLRLVAQSFATGDLNVQIKYPAEDEIGIVAESFRVAARDLAAHLRDKETAEHLAHEADLAKGRAEAANEAIISSITYASKIQKTLRPPDDVFVRAFADHHVIWEPRDIVGGDIYWLKNYPGGSVLGVCDCTGHGTPGALLTMLVVTILESSVNLGTYTNMARLIWRLDQRLAKILNVNQYTPGEGDVLRLNDGCDIALIFMDNDGSVDIASSGIPVFVCDGQTVSRVRGQNLRIGEGLVKRPDTVTVTHVPYNPDNKFYIASDGLYDQIGGPQARPFGYGVFKDLLLAHHKERQAAITGKIWAAFEKHRGAQLRRDDVELVTFVPRVGIRS